MKISIVSVSQISHHIHTNINPIFNASNATVHLIAVLQSVLFGTLINQKVHMTVRKRLQFIANSLAVRDYHRLSDSGHKITMPQSQRQSDVNKLQRQI